MKNNNIFIKFVKRLLISHYSEFTYKRYFVRDLKNHGTYILKFSKIPNVEIYIKNNCQFDLWISIEHENKSYFANPLDLTTVIKKDKKGYFCSLCIEKSHYKNKEEIWKNHLKDLISWAKDNLKSENEIVVKFFGKHGSYDIEILQKSFEDKNRNNNNIIPLFS